MNWGMINAVYGYDAYELALNKVPIAGNDAWSRVNWFSWEDSNLGIPVAACRLSVRGYIYADAADQIQPAEMAARESDDYNNLPTLRYIMPIPQDAISRSNSAYKNYYGY